MPFSIKVGADFGSSRPSDPSDPSASSPDAAPPRKFSFTYPKPRPHPTTLLPLSQRAAAHPNPAARRLLEIMQRKQTNLCVSVDLTEAEEVLRVVREVGGSVCMIKTHADIISDFTPAFASALSALAASLDFVIFEDRKFADIGNTVSLQYSAGPLAIASWAEFTNAHPLPGPGIIRGLGAVGRPKGRALLLLAEMSSGGNLLDEEYSRKTWEMARREDGEREWVVGFIGMSRPAHDGPEGEEPPDYLILTPGVSLSASGDALGQQYRSPKSVVFDSGCDVIIVGRGVYATRGKERETAEEYRREGWRWLEERVKGGNAGE